MNFSQLENPFAFIFSLVVGPGGQYEIDFFEKCLFVGKLDKLLGVQKRDMSFDGFCLSMCSVTDTCLMCSSKVLCAGAKSSAWF